jgi:solute carrier family 25 oxoglutarate transporter 11
VSPDDEALDQCKRLGIDGTAATLLSAGLAGAMASLFSLPFDLLKTRVQKQRPLSDGTLPYANTVDCMRKVRLLKGRVILFHAHQLDNVRIDPKATSNTFFFFDAVIFFSHLLHM